MMYRLDEFRPADRSELDPPASEAIELGQIEFFDSLDDLPAGISARIRKVIELGPAADPKTYPSRNEAVMAVCCAGVAAGWTNEQIAAVITDPKWGISERVRERGGKAEAAREIAKARSLVGRVRPQIVYDEDRLAEMMEEIDAALRDGEIPIYQMDGRLVRAVRLGKECDDEGVNRKAGAVVIRDVGVYFLKERMREAAKFVVAKRKDGAVVFETMKKLPLEFARHFADRPGEWNLPLLAGICEAPTLRDDGSVVSEQGYDPQSGLIIDTQGVDFPAVPDQPSKADATAALDTLIDVIAEFPFEPDEAGAPLGLGSPSASRSVALSMILTAVIRRSLRTAPLHGISAPTMATGKSLLADVAAMIATGRLAPMMSYASNEDENEKRLLASLRQGDPLLAIDNIEDPVSGASLCSILTAEVWKSRILGVSLNATVSTKTLMIANGNNLSFRGDIATRVIVSRLDARCDDPGERPAFRYDLKQHIPRERPKLVAAALTVLRAYIVAGYPLKDEIKPLSRFEDWSRLVRDALIWLGQSDPVATRKKVAATDTEGAALAGLLAEWQKNFAVGEWKLPSEVIELANLHDGSERRPMPLGIALGAFCASRNGVTAIGLGRRLSKYANRRVGGRWIEADIDPAGKVANQYRLMTEELERETQQRAAQGDMLRGE